MRVVGLAVLGCCAGLSAYLCDHAAATAQDVAPAWSAPELEKAVVVVDSQTRQPLAWDECLTALADCDAVFLGEQHTDEATHRFQLAVFEQLLSRKQNKVALALEMFDRDVQPALNRYLAGEINEATFLADARPWANYHEAYRPLVELAKKVGSPVIAANFPAPLRQRLTDISADAIASLPEADRALTPRRILPNSPAYWKRVDNAVRGHMGMAPVGESDDDRLYSTQSLWDNSMGEACADAIDKHPGHVIVHLNGGFHSAYGDGVVHQLRLRKPEARIKTVAIVPSTNPATARWSETPSADYVALVEARAASLDEGKRSVRVDQELSYLLDIPEHASPEQPVPLLIWLTDDGLTAAEGMELCRQRFGETAAIVVVEAPYKEMQFDLAMGGRWFWPETFEEDAGKAAGGIEEIWAYVLRHFPIDPTRVCLAGEGTGATLAAVAAVHTDRMRVRAVAINPRQYAKLKDAPLPLPEYRLAEAMPERSLVVASELTQKDDWTDELAAYTSVGVPSRFIGAPADPLQAELQQHNLLAEALGCEPRDADNTGQKKYLVVEADTARASHWGRLQAHWLGKDGGPTVALVDQPPADAADAVISSTIAPAAAARPGVLPRCPGPFGGTTVIVLADGTPDKVAAEWFALEEQDPLAKGSRFHRVRVAVGDGERSLPKVLAKLQTENRRNVLISPAEFYASADKLQSLRRTVRESEDGMTLQWLPGLGGREHALRAE